MCEKVLYLAVAAAQEGEPWQSRQKVRDAGLLAPWGRRARWEPVWTRMSARRAPSTAPIARTWPCPHCFALHSRLPGYASHRRPLQPDRVTARLLQLVLHRDSTLEALLAKYDQIKRTVRQFMDSKTASLLVKHGVVGADAVPAPDEPLLAAQPPSDADERDPAAGRDEEALIAAHDKAQTEWQRRKDDAVTDAHLAQVRAIALRSHCAFCGLTCGI